jgi:hypothetical protein
MTARPERLYSDVAFLSGIRPYRNYKNLYSLEKASSYITNEIQKAGLKAEEQKWIARGKEYRNIVASYQPDKLGRLIIGAHYDVAGNQPGADDNASGIAGLLETARLVMENKPDLDYGIDFIAYCLEEPPFFGTELLGSYIHAESLFRTMTPVIGMICFEMIGYFSDEPGSQKIPPGVLQGSYPDRGDFIVVVGVEKHRGFSERFHRLMAENSPVDVRLINFPDDGGFAGMSDQSSYRAFGYKALMINDTSFLRNKNYHKKSDTADTLDFARMAQVLSSAYKAITGMADVRRPNDD